MASELVISTGIPDTQMYLQAIANVDAPYDVKPQSGGYPLVGDILVNRKLANRWIAVNLAKRAFVDGMGVTSVSAEAENVGFLRFPLLYLPPRLKRTLGTKLCPSDDTANGTPGNNEPFNKNLPHGLITDGYDMKFTQEYDEAAQVSRVNMRLIGSSLDLLGQHTSYIPQTVGLLQDADVVATHIGSALANSAKNGNSNIIAYNPATTDDGYVQGIMNKLASSLSNVRGSYKEGIVSYPKDKSVFIMRWRFFNQLMTIKNGAIVNSDIGQKILINGYLDDSGSRLLGNYIEGRYAGIYIKVLPDEIFDTAAATLGLTKAQYAEWNKVVAYIANAEGTLFGMSATVTDVDKSPTTSIGYIIRNDWGWGVKCLRPSSVALVVESANNLADFNNPVSKFEDINSPANMEGLIEGYQNNDEVSEEVVQRIAVSAPTLVTEVTLTVNGPESAAVKNAEVVVRAEDGTYPTVANQEDGTYTFTLPRASTATVAISADGYTANSANITVENTATKSYALTATLTAAAK